jgi:hypothetical protein
MCPGRQTDPAGVNRIKKEKSPDKCRGPEPKRVMTIPLGLEVK